MEILGIGTDIIEIDRVAKLLTTYNEKFINRIFSEPEKEYCLNKPHPELHIAGRFAAKEAVIKSLDSILDRIKLKDIEIHNLETGKPCVFLNPDLNFKVISHYDIRFEISISHSKTVAVAFAICYRS